MLHKILTIFKCGESKSVTVKLYLDDVGDLVFVYRGGIYRFFYEHIDDAEQIASRIVRTNTYVDSCDRRIDESKFVRYIEVKA